MQVVALTSDGPVLRPAWLVYFKTINDRDKLNKWGGVTMVDEIQRRRCRCIDTSYHTSLGWAARLATFTTMAEKLL